MSGQQRSTDGMASLEALLERHRWLDDPGWAWGLALRRWVQGDDTALQTLMRGTDPVPAFAREWLALAVAGQVKRKRGAKAKPGQSGSVKVFTLAELKTWSEATEVYEKHLAAESRRVLRPGQRDATPSVRALESAAKALGMTDRQLSEIVHRRRRIAAKGRARIPGK